MASANVLVVDDDPALIGLARLMLEECGCLVLIGIKERKKKSAPPSRGGCV